MRIRIIRRPTEAWIDGLRLDQFHPGQQYDVGNTLGAVLLAERWAEPVDDSSHALVIPLRRPDKRCDLCGGSLVPPMMIPNFVPEPDTEAPDYVCMECLCGYDLRGEPPKLERRPAAGAI